VNQGLFQIEQTCPRCHGSGRVVDRVCPTCKGSGSQRRTRTFQVRVPPGVKDGARIRLRGHGEPGPPGAEPGDLYVRVHVRPHPFFRRRGDDLAVEVPITYTEAALGAEIQVPTLDGPVTMRVPPGTPSGKTFRLRGKGAPRRGGQGDLYVTVNVEVPARLSKEERELLEKLRAAERESPRRRLGVSA
jgi:molecular chaperone DnaJ